MTEAAFFDLDKTLLPGSSLFPIAREMYRRRVLKTTDLVRFAVDQIGYRVLGTEDPKKIARAREGALEGVKGRSRDEVLDVGRGIVRRELLPRMYPQAVELIARHQRLGRKVYVSSSSPEDLLVLLGEDMGLDGVIGTRALVDAGGIYTGELDGDLCHREEKARRVEEVAKAEGIDLAQSYAYSDSLNDLPLLELVGNPVATNPDRSLYALARRRGWPVLDFRTGRRRALIASAAGGGAVAFGGLGYALGYAMGRRHHRRRALLGCASPLAGRGGPATRSRWTSRSDGACARAASRHPRTARRSRCPRTTRAASGAAGITRPACTCGWPARGCVWSARSR